MVKTAYCRHTRYIQDSHNVTNWHETWASSCQDFQQIWYLLGWEPSSLSIFQANLTSARVFFPRMVIMGDWQWISGPRKLPTKQIWRFCFCKVVKSFYYVGSAMFLKAKTRVVSVESERISAYAPRYGRCSISGTVVPLKLQLTQPLQQTAVPLLPACVDNSKPCLQSHHTNRIYTASSHPSTSTLVASLHFRSRVSSSSSYNLHSFIPGWEGSRRCMWISVRGELRRTEPDLYYDCGDRGAQVQHSGMQGSRLQSRQACRDKFPLPNCCLTAKHWFGLISLEL